MNVMRLENPPIPLWIMAPPGTALAHPGYIQPLGLTSSVSSLTMVLGQLTKHHPAGSMGPATHRTPIILDPFAGEGRV